MFQVGISGIGKNGFTNMLMTSHQNTEKLIKEFKAAMDGGSDPNAVNDMIFEKLGLTHDDLMESDKKRLISEVENYYRKIHRLY